MPLLTAVLLLVACAAFAQAPATVCVTDYGADASGVRDSAPEPTKSGVAGLLGCALGITGDEELRALSCSLRIGVRCDRAGTPLVDYHTVGGGYDTPQLLNAEGKAKLSSSRPHVEQTLSLIHISEPTRPY